MNQHKFTHLGEYPYRLVDYFYDKPTQLPTGEWVGGNHSCSHCGRGISHVFKCQSSDGKIFYLGSQHVEELGDEGLTKVIKDAAKRLKKQVKEENERIAQIKYWEENRERIEKERQEEAEKSELLRQNKKKHFDEEYERVKPILKSMPHPKQYFARKGMTLLDYVNYFLKPDQPMWMERNHPIVLKTLRNFGATI